MFFPAGVVIGLENDTLSVPEDGGEVEVCVAVLQGSLQRTVTVSFSTSDGTAFGIIYYAII